MSPAPRTARPLLAALTVLLVAALAGCGGEPVTPPASAASVSDTPDAGSIPVVKRTVLLDPGHNGGNASHPDEINKKVRDGRGGKKPCNTVGTQTNDGYPEHKFAWDVALRAGELLVRNNVNVKLTRTNDTGVGPCVDMRGKMAELADADAVVSIHADGADPSDYGFHVSYPKPPLNAAQGKPSVQLATSIRDALRGAGLPEANYIGKAGLNPRSDLAGLNLSTRPIALVECANMRNPQEAVTVSNPAGRQRYAQAIAIGVLNWLAHLPPPKTSSAAQSASTSKSTSKSSSKSSAETEDSTEDSSESASRSSSRSTASSARSTASGHSSSSSRPGSSGSTRGSTAQAERPQGGTSTTRENSDHGTLSGIGDRLTGD